MLSQEVNLLREEIRYMRRKLLEAENAEKDLKLEFEMYRANREIVNLESKRNYYEPKEENKWEK
jgi:hypothetical protein